MEILVNWSAENFFGVERKIFFTHSGSGDTRFHWYALFIILNLSVIGTAIWTLIGKRKVNYSKLYYWLTVFVRYYIGIMLIVYGIVKLFKSQFPFPNIIQLTKPLLQFSPMELTWAFFGSSTAYNIFIGIAEILGVLLLFRKTATLGTLIALATSLNIMAINYFYDVPVKMVSTILVLLSIYLLAPNIKRLFNFLVLQKNTALLTIPKPAIKNKIVKWSLIGLKYLSIITPIAATVYRSWDINKYLIKFVDTDSELFGYYYIPLSQYENRISMDIPSQWQQFVFRNNETLIVRTAEMNSNNYTIKLDTTAKELKIIGKSGEKDFVTSYKKLSNGNLELTDLNSENNTKIILTKINIDEIPLKTNGFRWVIGE